MKKRKKKNITGIITTILAFTVLAASFIFFTYLNIRQQGGVEPEKDNKVKQTAQIVEKEGIQPELVCMVNDAYMGGKKQIPVPVGDKVYYGCCEMCVDKLHNENEARFGEDPVTGEAVDKSEAFIVLKPGSDSEVLYFKSEDNYHDYKTSSTH